MKKLKYEILFIILFMTVGIAAVSSNLLINGTTPIASNPDDFNVYFSQILNESHPELDVSTYVYDTTRFTFNAEFSSIDHYVDISFYVTNSSKFYDADVSISCTGGEGYLHVWYEFSDNIVPARETRMGRIEVSLIRQTVSENLVQSITCKLNAEAIERSSNGSGVAEVPVLKDFSVGEVVAIGEEKFNVISDNGDTVTLLAQYNLGIDYKQSSVQNGVKFAGTYGWEYTPGSKEIDIQNFDGPVKTYVIAYVEYLKEELGDDTVTGDLITLKDLEELGCTVPSDSAFGPGEWDCYNSPFGWIANGQYWWTRSAILTNSDKVWGVNHSGGLDNEFYNSPDGVRPVITISKSTLEGIGHVRLIIFTIEGKVYYAEEGMTWGEWVDSSYNTAGLVLSDVYIVDEREYRVYNSTEGYIIISNNYINSGSSYAFSSAYLSQ